MGPLSRFLAVLLGLGLAGPAASQVPPPVPALPDSARLNTYTLSASTCVCSVGFAIYADGTDVDEAIQVFIGTTQYLSTDPSFGWSLSSPTGSWGSIARPVTDALLTFNTAQTGQVTIVGARRPRRLSQFNENAGIPARNHNQVLTDIIATQREQYDKALGALVGQPGESVKRMPAAATRANQVLAFDAFGNPTVVSVPASIPSGQVQGPGSSTIGHIATWANTLGTLLADTPIPGFTTPACTRMWPSVGQFNSVAWNVVDAYGNTVNTSGSNSQGLQEAINFSINNGQCLQVFGQSNFALGSQSATLNSTTTVTGLTSTASLLVGDYVTAAAGGIPTFTQIASIVSGTSITLNNAATVSATRTLKFTRALGTTRQLFLSSSVTITVPPTEQWDFHAYNFNMACTTAVNGPCWQFDSSTLTVFEWNGQIVYEPTTPNSNACAFYFAPTNPIPLDGTLGVDASKYLFPSTTTISSSGTVLGSLCFDGTAGSIITSQFGATELNGGNNAGTPQTSYGILARNFGGSPYVFEQNNFDFPSVHLHGVASVAEGIVAGVYRGNNWRIGGARPAAAGTCYSTFAANSRVWMTCSGEEAASSTIAGGINFQTGSAINYVDMLTVGTVTTYVTDNGLGNNRIVNGVWQDGLWTYSVLNALYPCNAANKAKKVFITDSTVSTWGAAIAGSGSSNVQGVCNGSAWIVSGGGTQAEIRQMIGFTNGTVAVPQNTSTFMNTIANGTESLVFSLCPIGGTFKNLYIQSTAPANGQTLTSALRINGTDSALTCTITGNAGGTNTTCNDTTHTAACTAGQTYSIHNTTSATTGSLTSVAGGVEFDNP